MKIVNIMIEDYVPKTEEELAKDREKCGGKLMYIPTKKLVPLKEPLYIVAMSMEELQLVSFYLELEKRKPIMNIEITKE